MMSVAANAAGAHGSTPQAAAPNLQTRRTSARARPAAAYFAPDGPRLDHREGTVKRRRRAKSSKSKTPAVTAASALASLADALPVTKAAPIMRGPLVTDLRNNDALALYMNGSIFAATGKPFTASEAIMRTSASCKPSNLYKRRNALMKIQPGATEPPPARIKKLSKQNLRQLSRAPVLQLASQLATAPSEEAKALAKDLKKTRRRTRNHTALDRALDLKLANHEFAAFNAARADYELITIRESHLPVRSKNRTSAVSVCDRVGKQWGVKLDRQRLLRYRNKKVPLGHKLKRGGREIKYPPELIAAMAMYHQLKQVAGGNGSAKSTVAAGAAVFESRGVAGAAGVACSSVMQARLQVDHANVLSAGCKKNVEGRRFDWSRYDLYLNWFEKFESEAVRMGHAIKESMPNMITGGIQSNIRFLTPGFFINLDETGVPMNGDDLHGQHSTNNILCNTSLPMPGAKTTQKSSNHVTALFVISPLGDAALFLIPDTDAQITSKRRINHGTHSGLPRFHWRGKWHDVQLATNQSGGMNQELWPQVLRWIKYVLFEDPENPGTSLVTTTRRLVIKVDAGPGKENLLQRLDASDMGIDLIPGFPNGSGFNQECDVLYELIKSAWYANANRLENIYHTLKKEHIPEIMNGKIGDKDDHRPLHKYLTAERIIGVFAEVGACTYGGLCTRASLKNCPKLRHKITDKTPAALMIKDLRAEFDENIKSLQDMGFDTAKLEELPKERIAGALDDKMTHQVKDHDDDHQSLINIIAATRNSAGSMFSCVGCTSHNSSLLMRGHLIKLMRAAETKVAVRRRAATADDSHKLACNGILDAKPLPPFESLKDTLDAYDKKPGLGKVTWPYNSGEMQKILSHRLRKSDLAVSKCKSAAERYSAMINPAVYNLEDDLDVTGEYDDDELICEFEGKKTFLSNVHELVERIKISDPSWSPDLYEDNGSLVLERRNRDAYVQPDVIAAPADDGNADVEATVLLLEDAASGSPTKEQVKAQNATMAKKVKSLQCRLAASQLCVEAKAAKEARADAAAATRAGDGA